MNGKEGLFSTVKPMAGSHLTILSQLDHWTVTTREKCLSALFEHTVGVTSKDFDILYEACMPMRLHKW